MKWTLIASGSVFLSLMTFAAIVFADHISEASVAFKSEAYSPGEAASFIVVDQELSLPASCTASWGPLSRTVLVTEPWSLTTGEPDPQSFSLSEGCAYDVQEPPKTPLRFDPAPKVKVNGVSVFSSALDVEAGAFFLSSRVNASSTVSAIVFFDAPDIYLPADGLIIVSSTSDVQGEPVGMREVAGEEDEVDSPDSGVFLGHVDLNDNPDATASGDGAIYVKGGDTLTVSYLDGGEIQIASAQATVKGVMPTPTPIPAAGTVASVALALSLAVILAWKLTRPETTRRDA